MPKLVINKLAEDRGITQYRLQKESQVNWPTVQRYWHNEVKVWDSTVLKKFADVLGVQVSELIENGDAEPKAEAVDG